MPKLIVALLFIVIGHVVPAFSEVLTQNTVWQGEINLKEDVLIPVGVVVEVRPGTKVNVWPSENTQIDPEYLTHDTEILVRGELRVLGSAEEPVVISMAGDDRSRRWTGIIVQGGKVVLSHAVVKDAEAAVYVVQGRLESSNSQISENRYGLIAQGSGAALQLLDTIIVNNDYGLFDFDGATISREGGQLQKNSKKDKFSGITQNLGLALEVYKEKEKPLTGVYKNETLRGNNIWSGRIRIDGQVRLAVDGRLVIMPGTVVEFSKRDTNGDGIGENGILIQGAFFAKGTAEEPIIFRSAETNRGMGDWDAINILGSDQTRNLIEFCHIENAYRSLHFHFANVAVTHSVLRGNFRGLQFQESLVELRENQFSENNSAIQARDSQVILKNNQVFNNINGVDLFRMNLKASGNLIANNLWDGMRIREGVTNVEGNMLVANRNGLVVSGAFFGTFSGNLTAGNLENGIILQNNDNIECARNAVLSNGINGIRIKDSRAIIQGNTLADNGERGIGIASFNGLITANNFSGNGVYAIGVDGSDAIDATGNWWSGADLAKKIFDKNDDPSLGVVDVGQPAVGSYPFAWPVPLVPIDMSWGGALMVNGPVDVAKGATLTIKPGTVVSFAPGVGVDIVGTIKAIGTEKDRITFTSQTAKGPNSWGEIHLETAINSIFENCDFENAEWAIHSHFTNLVVRRCRFRNNDGGLRFTSGPMLIVSSIFRGNRIGLRSFRGFGEVRDSVFSGNEIGMFIRENGSGMKVVHNNLNGNERYSLRLGDFNAEDVAANNNWWGVDDVVGTLFDINRESTIGRVLYEPVLREPIVLELEEWK